MAGTLAVVLSNSSATYALPAEQFDISIGKSPFQAPIPANSDPLLIDLGQFRPSIFCSGTLDPGDTSDGANDVPTKRELEDYIKASYNLATTITCTFGGIADAYVGKFSSVVFKAVPASAGRWVFTIQMLTVGRS